LRVVTETLQKKGKVIIPAFSVGRTQQIVYVLHELLLAKKLRRSRSLWTARERERDGGIPAASGVFQ